MRRIVQLAAAALFNGYAVGFAKGEIFTGASKAFCVPVLNCYSCPGALGSCPIGALQAALGGTQRSFPFYVLGTLMLFGVLLGRAVCGLLCPFGLVQDLLHKIPTPKLRVPRRVDRPLRRLKYVVLALMVVVLPFVVAGVEGIAPPFFCEFLCPAGTLGAGIPLLIADGDLRGLVGALFNWKVAVLVAILVAAVLIPRPFCRYLCPLGAFYSLFNRFSLAQVELDRSRCTGCGACAKACPMAVEPAREPASSECIRCGKCARVCPASALTCTFAGKPVGRRRGAGRVEDARRVGDARETSSPEA